MIITGDATNHEELFELLGGLGEGVELAGVETGGDEEVAGAFRGGIGEDGSGDFNEIMVVHVGADDAIVLGAATEDVLHGRATEV